jgi:hypothetical protein
MRKKYDIPLGSTLAKAAGPETPRKASSAGGPNEAKVPTTPSKNRVTKPTPKKKTPTRVVSKGKGKGKAKGKKLGSKDNDTDKDDDMKEADEADDAEEPEESEESEEQVVDTPGSDDEATSGKKEDDENYENA